MFPGLIDKLQRRIDLSVDEAAEAMDTIMDGRAQPSQIAGFLVGLAMKGERPDEIVGLARTISPPKAWPIPWCPRQTPSTGTRRPNWRMTSTVIPASSGRPGPGEMTMRSGFSASISLSVISSLRRTSGDCPSAPRYWARL